MRRFLLSLLLIGFGFQSGFASESSKTDPIEQKAQAIDKKLIAPCCWTATLDQHFSEVAQEMKDEIRSRLAQGQSEEQILKYFEDKYGERILSEPKASGFNLAVWIFPIVALLLGLFFLLRVIKTKTRNPTTTPVSTKEEKAEDRKYKDAIDRELYGS